MRSYSSKRSLHKLENNTTQNNYKLENNLFFTTAPVRKNHANRR